MDTKENKTIKFIIISILIIAVISLVGVAFARYVTMLNGNTQAPIAKWSFDSKILDSTQTEEVSDFSVTRTDDNDDVDPNTIAPGTSGEFIIEIDATGTETLLTYDVQITFTNKPTNLTFYSDSQKTNAIIIANNKLVLDGFMSLTDNKKREIPIYWDWALETGSTPSQIEDNDEIDTTFIGKTMSMQIATTGKQVTENPLATQYAVTLDANGGTIQGYGNSSQATKMVTYGDAYGNLPVPTRDGYEFKGWNGKNLINNTAWLSSFTTATRGTVLIEDNSVTLTATESDAYTNTYGLSERYYKIPIKPNSEYTFSWKSDSKLVRNRICFRKW